VLTTIFFGIVLETIAFQILIFLVTACIITIFLEHRYVIVYGITTFLIQVYFGIFNQAMISFHISPHLYFVYLGCYALGIYNIYILVRQANYAVGTIDKANKSKSIFLAAMAHEIRTPMNAIISLSQKILKEEQNEALIGYTEKIINTGNVLLSMTNGILDYTLIESGKYVINQVSYQPGSMIREVTEMTTVNLIDSNVDFVLLKESAPPVWLYGDEMRIRHILINVLSNAIKYTAKGQITMAVAWHQSDDANEGNLVFQISDTGCGIKQHDLDAIFETFTRLTYSPRVEGTGLGLTISRQLATLMGGEIKVESTFGVGSTFTVVIPQKIDQKGKMIKAPGAKILIVEDTRVNSLLLERLLEPYEIQFDEVNNGQECLDKLHDCKYDLILMDYLMPEMDGVETIHLIRKNDEKHLKEIPIILLSSGDEKNIKDELSEIGCQDYVEKPIDSEKLENIIINYLPERLIIEDV